MRSYLRLGYFTAAIALAYMAPWQAFGYKKLWGLVALVGAVLFVAFNIARKRYSFKELGFRPTGLRASAARVGIVAVIAAVVVSEAADRPPTFAEVVPGKLMYVVFAILQEFFFQPFVFMEFRSMYGNAVALIVTSLIFSSLHLFNPVLTPACFPMGLVLCWLYLRYRCFYEVALIHAVLGAAAALTLPHGLMNVAANYPPR